VRAVLDPNVLIAALLSRTGPPAQIVVRWLAGDFELVVSEELLAELERALAYPRLRDNISPDEAAGFVSLLAQAALVASDPSAPARRSADPADDYLIALAEAQNAVLVSGDRHLLELADRFPIEPPRTFLERFSRAR
jgi:putative PIN family toxin of toxin-antitoxin system